ncbi:nucleotidyl transferase AbiEii/AbiGii toxin family protein [bacterium]|nr:nucleotidyl transferase AbiEii/AbiGii toxin family protein [bacterium]
MDANYLHNHPNFLDLIQIVSDEKEIHPYLIEKDYWIMHCLFGLKDQGFDFELKGGTSLSKGFGIINRFSEDLDIRLDPVNDSDVKIGKNHTKSKHIEGRANYFNELSKGIDIDGIISSERDNEFDDRKLFNAGIRLIYTSKFPYLEGIKQGVLLELGFDVVTPNQLLTISSWVWDKAQASGVNFIDNRAKQVKCFLPQYTFVEKLQAISTKHRKYLETGIFPKNFMRHYYDIYSLLQNSDVLNFLGTNEYKNYKNKRFPNADNQTISSNDAFILEDKKNRETYSNFYKDTRALYYKEPPSFEEILSKIKSHILDM